MYESWLKEVVGDMNLEMVGLYMKRFACELLFLEVS